MTTFEDTPRDPVDGLGILLARYADTVLRPDPFAMDRVRAELRARAQRASVHRRAEALAVASAPRVVAAQGGLFRGWSLRRVSFATAASLILGLSVGTTTFAASRAGGALYEPRIWLETATLPRDPGVRLSAELAFASTRLAEAEAAASAHDPGAVAAALAAFTGIIEMTVDEQVAQGTGRDVAIEAFHHHLVILQALAGKVPTAAQAAVSQALAESDRAAHSLEAAPGKPADPGQGAISNGQGETGGQSGGNGQAGSGASQGGSNGSGAGVPGGLGGPGTDPSAVPEKTPKPTKPPVTTDPAPTPSHRTGGGNGGGGNAGGPGGSGGGQGASGGQGPPPTDPPTGGPVSAPGGGAKTAPGQQRTPRP